VIGSDVQAYNAALQSISGLTTSGNQMIYTTGTNSYATTTLTPFMRTLLDDADATAARGTLGLVIGSNVQAYNAALQSISGLSTSADQMVYTTGSNSYATTGLSSFMRTLLDDANDSTARTTLGLGSSNFVEFTGLATNYGSTASGRLHYYLTNGPSLRIAFGLSGTETGSNNGSNLFIRTYNDLGAQLSEPITITRSTGIVNFATAPTFSDPSNTRSNLGLAIGTNVQAYNAALQSISGLTTSADKMIYTTGSNAYATTGITSFGRTLVNSADASAARTSLGVVNSQWTTSGSNIYYNTGIT
jgi:hypothetical protein